ncbi:hypothetical protein [Maridesulfovibrio bastinii]|uniref:hypothetical protein n=1 Tax=Maridesulfovibrio bastinii TaxID=47157 RepID=UPI0004836C58|nr:hypothetical protein [Maridesulfovibrio bastinii]
MKQKKSAHILCHTLHKIGPKIEIFPAEQWDKPGAKEGLFRLRIDRIWYCKDNKYTFLTPSQIGEVVMEQLGLVEPKTEPKPQLKRRQRVSVQGLNSWTMGITGSDPIQGVDGRWRIWVSGYGFSKFYLCTEVRI